MSDALPKRSFVEYSPLRRMPSSSSAVAARSPSWVPFAIMATVAVVYANALLNGFVWDDGSVIVGNPAIKSWRRVPGLLSEVVLPGAYYYRPVQSLSFLADYYVWGLWPAGFHLTNVVLHAVVAVLFYRLAARLVGDWRTALVAALLFAVHPLHAEAITYVSQRSDPLAAMFMLTALLWALDGRRIAAPLAFALALLSRESAAILLLLLPMVLLVASSDSGDLMTRVRSVVWRWVPFAVVGGLYVVARSLVVSRIAPREETTLSLATRLLTLPEVILTYLQLLIAPVDLHMERNLAPASVGDPTTWIAAAVVVAIGAAAVAVRSYAWPVTAGIVWFAIALLPVANIVPLPTFVAEHWVYVPSMGLFLAAGWVLVNVVARRRATVAVPTLLVLVLLYGARTVRRNADWRDERTFFEATLRYAPTSALVHGNLGRVYFESGEIEKAKSALARAVEIEPSHVRSSDAYNLLGMIAQSEGHPEEAIRLYRRAIEINARPAEAYTNLASVLLDLGRVDEARGALEAALHADPTLPVAHVNLGNILVQAGNIAGALREYQRAIQFDPSYPLAHRNLGRLYLLQGRPELAEAEFRAALSLEPDSVSARQGLEAALGMQSQRRRDH